MEKDKIVGNSKEIHKFVAVYWLRHLIQGCMKTRILKRLEMYKVRINPALDGYLELPLFQDKLDEGNALLARVGLPDGLARRD